MTDAQLENCLVAKGDIKITVKMYPVNQIDKSVLTKENYKSV